MNGQHERSSSRTGAPDRRAASVRVDSPIMAPMKRTHGGKMTRKQEMVYLKARVANLEAENRTLLLQLHHLNQRLDSSRAALQGMQAMQQELLYARLQVAPPLLTRPGSETMTPTLALPPSARVPPYQVSVSQSHSPVAGSSVSERTPGVVCAAEATPTVGHPVTADNAWHVHADSEDWMADMLGDGV